MKIIDNWLKEQKFVLLENEPITNISYIDALYQIASERNPIFNNVYKGYLDSLSDARTYYINPQDNGIRCNLDEHYVNIGIGLRVFACSKISDNASLFIRLGASIQAFVDTKNITNTDADLFVVALNNNYNLIERTFEKLEAGSFDTYMKSVATHMATTRYFSKATPVLFENLINRIDLTTLTNDSISNLLVTAFYVLKIKEQGTEPLSKITPQLNNWFKPTPVWDTIKETLLNLERLGIATTSMFLNRAELVKLVEQSLVSTKPLVEMKLPEL